MQTSLSHVAIQCDTRTRHSGTTLRCTRTRWRRSDCAGGSLPLSSPAASATNTSRDTSMMISPMMRVESSMRAITARCNSKCHEIDPGSSSTPIVRLTDGGGGGGGAEPLETVSHCRHSSRGTRRHPCHQSLPRPQPVFDPTTTASDVYGWAANAAARPVSCPGCTACMARLAEADDLTLSTPGLHTLRLVAAPESMCSHFFECATPQPW